MEYLCLKEMRLRDHNYLKVDQIIEFFRQQGTRLIAVNDGVDSVRGNGDFILFCNIMNEFDCDDTSRKIRSNFQEKGKSGKRLPEQSLTVISGTRPVDCR